MIKFPKNLFNDRLKNNLTINRRSIRFYLNPIFLIPKAQIEYVLTNHVIDGDENSKCAFCGFLRMFTEITFELDNDFVYFKNEKFNLESRICFCNSECDRSGYKHNSKEYFEKVLPLDIAKQKIQNQRNIAMGRYTEEWFIKKYGEEDGNRMYNEFYESSKVTLDKMISKYGLDEGTKRYDSWLSKVMSYGQSYSKLSQKLFWSLYEKFKDHEIYFFELNHEYQLFNENLHRYYMIDFYDKTLNKSIEFNGDYWHMNPDFYEKDSEQPSLKRSALSIWKNDEIRMDYIKSTGISSLVVWESKFLNNSEKILNECVTFLEM